MFVRECSLLSVCLVYVLLLILFIEVGVGACCCFVWVCVCMFLLIAKTIVFSKASGGECVCFFERGKGLECAWGMFKGKEGREGSRDGRVAGTDRRP